MHNYSPLNVQDTSPKQNCLIAYWNDNSKLPIHSTPKERISTADAVNIIIDENFKDSKLCQMQPTCVDKNTVFVVDLDKISDPKDITCDDMGSWRANGTHACHVITNDKGDIISVAVSQKKISKHKGKHYKLTKRYYYHKTSTDLNKTIFLLQGKIIMYFMLANLSIQLF